jgi:hypothetical protein
MLGITLGGIGSAGSTDTSGHPVADSLGVSKEPRSDQAGSGRVGEREGEHGTTLGGDEAILLGLGDGLFVLGDF